MASGVVHTPTAQSRGRRPRACAFSLIGLWARSIGCASAPHFEYRLDAPCDDVAGTRAWGSTHVSHWKCGSRCLRARLADGWSRLRGGGVLLVGDRERDQLRGRLRGFDERAGPRHRRRCCRDGQQLRLRRRVRRGQPGGDGRGDFVSWFIDTDDNVATGSQSGFRGADHVLGRLPNGYVGLSRYNASTGRYDVVKEGFPLGEFGGGVHLSDFDASPGVTFRVAGGNSWTSTSGAAYFDFAPNNGTVGFGVQFASASGPESGPVQPTQPQSPVEQVPTPGQDPIRTGPTVTD